MNHKKIIFIGVVVLGILALFMVVDYKNKNGSAGQALSPNILYVTQPVTSFSGVVDKIEGNRLTVTQKQILTQNIVPPIAVNASNRPSPLPTPKTVTLTYQVVVTDKTQISQSASFINYLFKTVTPPGAPELLTVKNIKVGQYVTVNSQVDLRTLVGNVFEATIVNLPQKTNSLNGKIISLEGNTLTVKGFAPMAPFANPGAVPATPQEKQYRISITSDTEISRNVYSTNMTAGEPPTPPKPEKLAISDLKVDMQTTVYTAEDVTETQTLTALRIEPAQPMLAPPIPSASTSPLIKP